MLQVARLSPTLLGDSADLTARFLASRQNPDGGFQDRSGSSDLYYTVFGLEGLCALQRDVPVDATRPFVAGHGDGGTLDLVHAACLARCWANLAGSAEAPRRSLAARLEAHRTPDGGYAPATGADTGTAYACFLAVGAHEDLGEHVPDPDGVVRCLDSLRAAAGGVANHPDAPTGLTPPTAAAITLYRHLDRPVPPDLVDWLLDRHRREGGFVAGPDTPAPDLLSTATALHALTGAKAPTAALREPCLDFVDSLWTNQGGFYGHWGDDVQDCEYTYYALLALGHLSL